MPPPGLPLPQFSAAGGADFFSTGIIIANPNLPRFHNSFQAREIRGTGVVEWTVTIWDFTGGLNTSWGDFNAIPNRVASSSLWTHYPGFVMLPFTTGTSDVSASWGVPPGIHHYNIFGTMAIGIGPTANNCLYTATTAGPSARTFTPNGNDSITCLAGIIIGGNTSAERLIVGSANGVAEILSDLAATPTSSGDMHANTQPLWGMIPTGLPDPSGTAAFVNLLYANGNIYRMLTTAAIGDAPTTTNTPAPNGGFAIGVSAASGPKRAYWVWPKQTTAGGMLATEGALGFIWSTNLEGSDAQKLDIPLHNGVTQACLFQDGIVYTDGREVYWYRQARSYNLGWSRERAQHTSNVVSTAYRVAGFGVYRGKLRILSTMEPDSGINTEVTQWEEFNETDFSWHAGAAAITNTDDKTLPYRAAGSLPFSIDGSTIYFAKLLDSGPTNRFYRQLLPPPSQNPFYHGSLFHNSGALTSPIWFLPGLMGVPSVIYELVFGGSLNATFTTTTATGDSNVIITIGTQGQHLPGTTSALTEVFNARDRTEDRIRRFPDNTDSFVQFQLTATLVRDTAATATSPSLVPLIIRGLAFPNGDVRRPREVLGS